MGLSTTESGHSDSLFELQNKNIKCHVLNKMSSVDGW